MKKLRKWQQAHLDHLLESLGSGKRIWLSQVVTGGGKTRFGAHAAATLLDSGEIDRVVVLCPSVGIAKGWVRAFNKTVGTLACYSTPIRASFESVGADDVNVLVCTYAGAGKVSGSHRTLVILDEIHHAEREASWGLTADQIADKSKFTLALTGTPWMTRGKIAILEKNGYYVGEEGKETIVADGNYTYAEDLTADHAERATVPLRCTFFASNVKVSTKHLDGNTTVDEHKLHAVTEESRAGIVATADRYTPLKPHVLIDDNSLSGNVLARSMLAAATVELDAMAESEVFRKARKKPMGLVTCSSIVEATRVYEYLSAYDVTAEVIHSEDDKAAKRIEELSSNTGNPAPQWLVTVGMVSEGVDIPAIKVVVYLNQITTMLFLIQLIGRALRRIPHGSGYLDKTLTETTARIFAPAHPRIVKVGTELEHIGNQAIKVRGEGEPTGGDGIEKPPQPIREYERAAGDATVFFRGAPVNDADLIRKLNAIQADQDAMETLTPLWLDLIHQWIMQDSEVRAVEEVDRQLQAFNIEWGEASSTFREGLDYDVARSLQKKEANRLTQLIRFAHPSLKYLPDADAFREVRHRVCKLALGQFKTVDKMTLEELRRYVDCAQRVYRTAQAEGAAA